MFSLGEAIRTASVPLWSNISIIFWKQAINVLVNKFAVLRDSETKIVVNRRNDEFLAEYFLLLELGETGMA
jgi:hypothetical protein